MTRDIDIAILSVRAAVCPSVRHVPGILWKRLNILLQFLHHTVIQSFYSFMSIKHISEIPMASPPPLRGLYIQVGYKSFVIFDQ